MLSSFALEYFNEAQNPLQFVQELINANPEAFLALDQLNLGKRTRIRQPRSCNLWDTPWGRTYQALEEDEDPNSYQHRKFRRRFRVPFTIFKYLVKVCKEKDVFELRRSSLIPIEIKLMISLRILGRDCCADDIAEQVGIGESSVLLIFKQFVRSFSAKCYQDFVYFPTGDELRQSMQVYERLGLPGCIGSLDGTKIAWDRCPSESSNVCTGKEKSPTLGFQCLVNHSRQIYHISSFFVGSSTDITMSYWDPVTKHLLSGDFDMISESLANYTFKTFDFDGKTTNWKGVYCITDRGYLKRSVFVDPDIKSFAKNHVMWSEWLESVRKDVECTFGILKARFRFLRNAVRYHYPDTIEQATRCCAILHNILLRYDGLDNLNWEKLLPDDEEKESTSNDQDITNEDLDYAQLHVPMETEETPEISLSVHDTTQGTFKNVLIEHFTHQYFQNELFWPRTFRKEQKEKHQISVQLLSRTLGADAMRYYVKPSTIQTRDGRDVGNGLFTSVVIPAGSTIAYFEGHLRTWEEVHNYPNGGRPNCYYMIQLSQNKYLDCYEYYKKKLCLASYANSPKGCNVKENGEKAMSNAKLVVQGDTAKLVAKRLIHANEEILWGYGNFKFPESNT